MLLNFRKIIVYFLAGIGFGSIIYIGSLWVSGIETQTLQQITNVVWISGLIGLISMIFETEKISFIAQLIIHFIVTYGLIVMMNQMNHLNHSLTSPHTWYFFGVFVLIYLSVWLVVFFTFYKRIRNINHRLNELKEK